MNFDISTYDKLNVIDTCSIWNIISCKSIYNATIEASCHFSLSEYVAYECFYKKGNKGATAKLKNDLSIEMGKGKFMKIKLSIDDLQEIELLENRKRLGMGELSSIALAKKTNQVFFTDDKKARGLGEEILGRDKVQTTPRLVGSFFYHRILGDGDLATIISEHQASLTSSWGDLTKFFNDVYNESLRRRAMDRITNR